MRSLRKLWAGVLFVITRRSPVSHAWRITADKMFPSRLITFRVRANSGSITSLRLSVTPGSWRTCW